MYPVICSCSMSAASLSPVVETCVSNWTLIGSAPRRETAASCMAVATAGDALEKNSRSTSPGDFSVAISKSFCLGVAIPSCWIFAILSLRASMSVSGPPSAEGWSSAAMSTADQQRTAALRIGAGTGPPARSPTAAQQSKGATIWRSL